MWVQRDSGFWILEHEGVLEAACLYNLLLGALATAAVSEGSWKRSDMIR